MGRCTSLVFTSRFRCSESMFMQQYSRFLANSPVITLIIDHRPTFSSTSRRGSTQLVKARSNILKIKFVSNITIFFFKLLQSANQLLHRTMVSSNELLRSDVPQNLHTFISYSGILFMLTETFPLVLDFLQLPVSSVPFLG